MTYRHPATALRLAPEVGFSGFPADQMRKVCSWCNTVTQEGVLGAPTSHTICAKCEAGLVKDVEPDLATRLAKYLAEDQAEDR